MYVIAFREGKSRLCIRKRLSAGGAGIFRGWEERSTTAKSPARRFADWA